MTRFRFTAERVRLAAISGAVALVAVVIGTTAALATSAERIPAAPEADLAAASAQLLTVQLAPPAPVVAPAPPAEGERLAVLTDAPADPAYDEDLRGSLDTAAIRAVDAAEVRRSAALTANWEREAASLQAQIDAAGRPAYEPSVARSQAPRPAEADTAAAGDTRSSAD